ncbi:MAG: zinc ribbon domain-containing protein [Lachnospiraceae bacterium]|jgi:rubrerythrin|nr:zinc ribbon domain-containing protein [Lachnospiraceae bacterium]
MAMDIKQGLSRQLTKINMKTSAFMEENKIKTYIATLESDIVNLKSQSGELGYNLWLDNKFDVEKLIPLYKEIAEKYQLIQEQEKLMKELEERNRQVLGGGTQQAPVPGQTGGNVCRQCGEVCPQNVNFCKKCGAKLR